MNRLSSVLVVALLCSTVPCLGAEPAVADPVTSGKGLADSRRKVSEALASVVRQKERVKALAGQRRGVNPAVDKLTLEVNRQLKAGLAAEKARGTSATVAVLDQAKADLESALARAAELKKQTDSLVALEAELERATNEAKASAVEAQLAARETAVLLQSLKQVADDARKAAASADQEASGARRESGIASAPAYAALKAKREREQRALQATVEDARKALAQVNARRIAAASKAPDPRAWRELYPSSTPDALVVRLSEKDGAALLKRFFPKFLPPGADCPAGWEPGTHTNEQARAAGMFMPSVLVTLEGPFTRRAAKQRLLWVALHECTATHVEGYGSSRIIVVEGARTVVDHEGFGLTTPDHFEDVDGDGVVDFTQVTTDMHQGLQNTSVVLSTLAGGQLHDLQDLGGESDPCGAGEEMVGPDATIERLKVQFRTSPKLEFKSDVATERCFPKKKRR